MNTNQNPIGFPQSAERSTPLIPTTRHPKYRPNAYLVMISRPNQDEVVGIVWAKTEDDAIKAFTRLRLVKFGDQISSVAAKHLPGATA